MYYEGEDPNSGEIIQYFSFPVNPCMKIYVPRNSVSVYRSATGWSYYASYIEGYDFSTNEVGYGDGLLLPKFSGEEENEFYY